jgi:hypothetical protein
MRNLESTRAEILEHLATRGIVAFQSFPRTGEPGSPIYWDTDRNGDFREFLKAAETAGVRLVTLFSRELDDAIVDDAIEQLAECGLDRDEKRAAELRLKEMLAFTGFTCEIELAFDLGSRTYIFDLRTEWFDDLTELIETIEESYQDDESDSPLGGGYFSRN